MASPEPKKHNSHTREIEQKTFELMPGESARLAEKALKASARHTICL